MITEDIQTLFLQDLNAGCIIKDYSFPQQHFFESHKRKARNKLFAKIGKDAYKWRFQVKRINDNIMQKGRRKYEC